MSDKHAHNGKVASKLLNTKEGGALIDWLKKELGFDEPVFRPEQRGENWTESALLNDGARQAVMLLLNHRDGLKSNE